MKPMEGFLTAEEMARLNAVLTRDEFWCPNVVAIIRLLMLTGCRFGEIAALEWDWIRGRRIHLPDSKPGPCTVWLSGAARAVIDAITRYSPDCPYLIPARPPTRPVDNIATQWHRIRDEAGLPGLRLHDLRHSCAPYLYNLLYSLNLLLPQEIRNRIVTGFDRIVGGACRASRAIPTIFRNRAISAIANFVALLRYPGGSVNTIS